MKGYRHNRVEVRRLASLPGIELWRYTAMELYSYGMLTPGYMFGGPDDKMTHAAAWIRGKKHELSDGAKVLLEPAEVYHVNGTPDPSERGSTSQVLIIQPSYLKYYLSDTQMESMNVARWRIHDAGLDTIFHVATSAMKSDAIDDIERESHVRKLLSRAFSLTTDKIVKAPVKGCARAVARVCTILQDCYGQRLTLTELAREVDLSIYHLERTFAETVGFPIHRMLQHIRVHRALAMLRDGRRPSDVWAPCGFSDQAHMTRLFQKLVYFTPGHYLLT